jgi:hypothetical protein
VPVLVEVTTVTPNPERVLAPVEAVVTTANEGALSAVFRRCF